MQPEKSFGAKDSSYDRVRPPAEFEGELRRTWLDSTIW